MDAHDKIGIVIDRELHAIAQLDGRIVLTRHIDLNTSIFLQLVAARLSNRKIDIRLADTQSGSAAIDAAMTRIQNNDEIRRSASSFCRRGFRIKAEQRDAGVLLRCSSLLHRLVDASNLYQRTAFVNRVGSGGILNILRRWFVRSLYNFELIGFAVLSEIDAERALAINGAIFQRLDGMVPQGKKRRRDLKEKRTLNRASELDGDILPRRLFQQRKLGFINQQVFVLQADNDILRGAGRKLRKIDVHIRNRGDILHGRIRKVRFGILAIAQVRILTVGRLTRTAVLGRSRNVSIDVL